MFEGFVNPVNDAMRLFDGGVSPPEAEQVSGINLLCSISGRSRLRINFSEFGYNGQETDWSVGE
jgi:hypothetical protein